MTLKVYWKSFSLGGSHKSYNYLWIIKQLSIFPTWKKKLRAQYHFVGKALLAKPLFRRFFDPFNRGVKFNFLEHTMSHDLYADLRQWD